MANDASKDKKAEELPNGRFSIPDESAAPKAESTPKYREKLENFADKPEVVEKALAMVQNYKRYCEDQPKRLRNTDIREQADSMWRIDKARTELAVDESANIEDTRANYPSTIYNETVKIISAGDKAVILGNEEEMPMSYEPLPDVGGYIEDEGLRVAEEQNTVLAWAFERDDMREKIGHALLLMAKYADQVMEMDWDYRVEERVINEPIFEKRPNDLGEGEELKVIGRKFKKKKVVVANNPRFNLHDMADCLFDANIDDVQMQNYFDIRKDMQLGNLWQLQASGQLINAGKIRSSNFNGEFDDNHKYEKQAREEHRGGSATQDNETNLVEVHRTRVRLPINRETGEWNEDKYLPTWYDTWWAGKVESNAVCLAITPNPHHCGEIPLLIAHSFEDDNGAFHIGNPELLKSGYSMLTTIINQYFDNISGGNQLPMVIERGAIGVRNNTVKAGGNSFIIKESGMPDPTPLQWKDTSQQTFTALDKAQDMIRGAAGVNKPLLGEGLGSRASASEAINTLNQALKPALEDAKYKANQILPFIAKWIMDMTRQFADPEQQISVKGPAGDILTAFPGRLYGEQVVRVVSIKKLQDSILRVQQEEQMMTQYVPVFKEYMTAEGITDLAAQIAKNRQFSNVDSWFKIEENYDATHVARSENQSIVFAGIRDFPQPEENHKAHIKEHEDFLKSYTYAVPAEELDKEGVASLKQHMAIHQQMMAEADAAGSQATPVPGGEPIVDEGAARTSGEQAGDIIAGGAASPGGAPVATAETGRPPLATV
jgi:hypothetical protein